jgi:DNA polymerase III epsilon subunit-like protein
VLEAHNAPFETARLSLHLDDFIEMDMPVVDSMKLSKMFVPETDDNKLETLVTHFGIPYDNGHRALHDAQVASAATRILTKAIYQP